MRTKSTRFELGLPTHSLVTDCPTQWGSKEKMVMRVNTSSVHVLLSDGAQPDLQNKVRRSIEDRFSDCNLDEFLNVMIFLDPPLCNYITRCNELAVVKDRLAEQEGSDLKTKSSPALPMIAT